METLKKLDNDRVEVTTTQESDVLVVEKKDILREIAECEETILRDKRWLVELDKTA